MGAGFLHICQPSLLLGGTKGRNAVTSPNSKVKPEKGDAEPPVQILHGTHEEAVVETSHPKHSLLDNAVHICFKL